MKSNSSLIYSLFLVIGDFLSLLLAFVGAYVLRVTFGLTFGSSRITHPVSAVTYLDIFLLLLLFWLIIFGLLGLYQESIYEKRFPELGRLFVGSFAGLLFVLGYAYISNKPVFPAKLVPVYGFVLAFVFLVLFRNIARLIRTTLFKYDFGITNLLIVGDNKTTRELIGLLSATKKSGYKIVGIIGEQEKIGKFSLPVYESFEQATKSIGVSNIHSIVQTELYSSNEKNDEILTYSQKHHIAFRFVPGNTELFVGKLQVELFRSSIPVVAVHQTSLIGWGRIVKRLNDVFFSLIIIIIASPFMLIIAIINIFSGPVFFRQTRLTRFNQEFRVFKFRTLKKGLNGTPEYGFKELDRLDLFEEFKQNGGKIPDDPRFTRFGRFLRKTSLDELPQLFNILKGDLSFVGPRALVPEEINVYSKSHAILSVKSGLTGLAQVSGRKDISFDERRQLDMYYVQNWSFWLDFVIVLKTIRVVFTSEGAN